LAFVGLGLAVPPKWKDLTFDYSFEQYKKDFGKHYDTPLENERRRQLFANSMEIIMNHNHHRQSSYKMGVNHMTDWTEEEFKAVRGYHRGLSQLQVAERTRKFAAKELPHLKGNPQALPHSVDWRTRGVLTAVKDQGHCGSCWTFAATETMESHWAIETGTLEVLSEQHILSCVDNPQQCGGTGGCEGGTAELAYAGMTQNGFASEWKYSYFSYSGKDYECHWSEDKVGSVAQLSGFFPLPPNDQEALMKALAWSGPVAVSVDASKWSRYESGIFDDCNQQSPVIDHGVQAVGYGEEKGQDFWIIRNSWSPSYGESGYIRIARQSTVTCGVDTKPLDGTGCVGGPPNVTVCGTCGVLFDNVLPIVDPYKA
jgi:cathepsin L